MLSLEQVRRLRRAGFIDEEISELQWALAPDGSPQAIDLSADVWQLALSSRRDWIERMRSAGLGDISIAVGIREYYRRRKSRSVWDFVRGEYKQSAIGRPTTPYTKWRQRSARRRTKRLYTGRSK